MTISKILISLLVFSLSAVAQTLAHLPDAPQPKETHKFFDWKNDALIAGMASAFVVDGISTQERFGFQGQLILVNGQLRQLKELDSSPICSAICKSRSGTSFYMSGSFGLAVGAMAFAHHEERVHPKHRKLWHTIERGIPITLIGVEAAAAATNWQTIQYDRRHRF